MQNFSFLGDVQVVFPRGKKKKKRKQAGAELCQAQSSAKLTATHKLVASK